MSDAVAKVDPPLKKVCNYNMFSQQYNRDFCKVCLINLDFFVGEGVYQSGHQDNASIHRDAKATAHHSSCSRIEGEEKSQGDRS